MDVHEGKVSYERTADGRRRLKRPWTIIAGTASDTWFDIEGDASFPIARYDVDPQDSDLRCLNFRLSHIDGLQWLVEADYDDSPDAMLPTDRPSRWKSDSAKYTKIITKDITEVPIKNTAGVPYRDFTVEETTSVFHVEKIYADTFDLQAKQALLRGKCNSDTWTTPFGVFDPHTCKCDDVSAEQIEENGTDYLRVSYQIQVNTAVDPEDPEVVLGWTPIKIQSQGTMQLDADGNIVNIYDLANGTIVSEPRLLDADGFADVAGVPVSTPFFLTFYPYDIVAFTGNIPTT